MAVKAPATLDTNSARLIFLVSKDNITYGVALKDDATRYTVTVSTTNTGWTYVNAEYLIGYRYVKLQVMRADGTTAVTQSTHRTFEYLLQRISQR